MRPGARFRYALETLLKQRRSEQDASAARERSARGVLEGHVEDTRRAQDALAGIEGALRKARLAGAPIDARQYEAAALYLVRMREALRIKARQTEKAQELHEQRPRFDVDPHRLLIDRQGNGRHGSSIAEARG